MSSILFVEDDPGIIDSVSTLLQLIGIDVHMAVTGKEAIDYIEQHKSSITLIFCDINMPDISGYAILQYVKNSPYLTSIPFVIVSAFADDKEVENGLQLGADMYITKPFTADHLLKVIDKYSATTVR